MSQLVKLLTLFITVLFNDHFVTCDIELKSFNHFVVHYFGVLFSLYKI